MKMGPENGPLSKNYRNRKVKLPEHLRSASHRRARETGGWVEGGGISPHFFVRRVFNCCTHIHTFLFNVRFHNPKIVSPPPPPPPPPSQNRSLRPLHRLIFFQSWIQFSPLFYIIKTALENGLNLKSFS